MDPNEEQDSDEGTESLPDALTTLPLNLNNVPIFELDGQIPILEADIIYLLMKRNIPISRTSRVRWLLDRLNTTITMPVIEDYNSWDEEQEFKILSIIPMDSSLYNEAMCFQPENSRIFKYQITNNTKLKFIAQSYRIVFCLDMSPSQSAVDIQQGEILFDEVLACFKKALSGMSLQFVVPGCSCVLQPSIYLTVIAHTPFFMTPAQQVLLKGIQVTSENIEEIFTAIEKQLKRLEEKIADVAGMAHDQIEEQFVENEKLVGGLFEEDKSEPVPNIPMVSPDANFVNMLRYSMLALSLLPENSLSNIIVITDGVVALPDVNILESLLMQLHYDSTAVSFIKVGSSFHPHVSAGYVPYNDVLNFLSHSTMGTFLCLSSEGISNSSQKSQQMNLYHKAYLIWTFHNKMNEDYSSRISSPTDWNTINEYFHGDKAPCLLRKKQTDEKINTSLLHILSRRMREGYTVDSIKLDNELLRLELSLPWKNYIYLQFSLKTPWPNQQSVVHYDVHIAAPYEFLHDITCLMKKELKSSYRQAVVERFWYVLTTLGQSDTTMAQHLHSFQTTNSWYTIPESVKNGMPVFVMMNSIPIDNFKPQFTAGDIACPKFGSAWQPICQLENAQWGKWFHTHKISLIIHHDDPRPRNLHLASSSGRFQLIQCRQAAAVLYGKLTEWATFVLIENHSYVKFLYYYVDKPVYFCILRVTSKLPCAVINIGFNNGTPGYIRHKVCAELREELSQLSYVSSPLKNKDNSCCTILHKPLEKMLIRYERMPSDFSTVVFPDGTQPPNPHQNHNPPLMVIGALFTTLSRYLYHKRWVWNATHPNNPKLGVNAIARILSTITKMRLKEGFTFAHSSSGIINMVLEVEMGPIGGDQDNNSNTLSCVIQYVLFPPHCTSRGEIREQNSGSEDETEVEQEVEMELQIVTEVWIEPQYGKVVNSPPLRLYMQSEPYYKLADKIGYVDSKCISSLLTLEHLSLMCQAKSSRFDEGKLNDNFMDSPRASDANHAPRRRKISNAKKRTSTCGLNSSKQDVGLGKDDTSPKSTHTFFQSDSAPSMEERIHHIPFHFNLNNILPLSQQTELLFSMFVEDQENKLSSDMEKSNKILIEIFHEHFQLLHDRELAIGPKDFNNFLELLRIRHKKVVCHKCPVSGFCDSCHDDPSAYQPQWRCFIKGVSTTHVILTFVPASLKDVKYLNIFNPQTTDSKNSESSTVNANSSEDEDEVTAKESKLNEIYLSDSLILPVYVYDCPLAVLMNSYINPSKNIKINIKDIYENYTYNINSSTYDYDSMKYKFESHQNLRSPDPKSEDGDTTDVKTCIKLHCRALILVHIKCFVVSLFKSLHCRSHISSLDIQYAVDQCEEATKDIDITHYLKVICSHLKTQTEKLKVQSILNSTPCGDIQPLHNLIKEKFMKIIQMAFQPVPTHPDFYYCHPCMLPPAVKSTTRDEDSDDEMSLPSEIVEFKSDTSLSYTESIPALGELSLHTETDITEADSEEIKPLFLHLTCTVYSQNTVFPSIPIKYLPTCLSELLSTFYTETLDPNDLKVTLDIICLTLPLEVHAITREFAPKGLRNTSFCSISPFQSSSTSSESSLISEDQDCNENMYSLNHLPAVQNRAVSTLKEDIEWLLKDEMATSLLDSELVTSETLNMVIKHVETSIDKVSCKKDVINLNFVYGTTHSHSKFVQEFKTIPLIMHDSTSYLLLEKDDLYYVAKKPPIEIEPIEDKKPEYRETKFSEDISSCINRQHLTEVQHFYDSNEHLFYQQSEISSNIGSVFGTEDYNEDSEDDAKYDWLTQLDKNRGSLPNFWLILKVDQDAVTIYFHCRFLELQTSKINSYLRVQRKVIYSIKDLCKRVNQSLLLQYLHDSRMCDRLLEPEDDRKEIWHSDNTTPTITRNTSYARLKSTEDALSDGMEYQQVAYLEASLKFMPGFFRCNVVWETHFSLHPRLKTGPGKSGLSRGIQALRTVLNKFSVTNRSNMFVYQDNNSNVFYLRLHENVQNNCTKVMKSRSELDTSNGVVSRSPSIVSLPLGQQKSFLNFSDNSILSITDIRPRVRSFGEKERTEVPAEDTIILKVHGITDTGLDIKRDLVQVLQNRLDDAVLEVLSMMLARNAMCPLTPEDVQFLQKPFRPPEHIIRLSVPKHSFDYINSFLQFLRQNLLQFLNIPKYTDAGSHNHFKDYSEPDLNSKMLLEDHIFLYNQGQNQSSGSRGIACVALAIVTHKTSENGKSERKISIDDDYMKLFKQMTFEETVNCDILPSTSNTEELPNVFLEFRIWKQGRVNLDSLNFKLKSAVSQSVWDLISEFHLLRAPLCYEEDQFSDSVINIPPPSPSHVELLRLEKDIFQNTRKRITKFVRRTAPPGSRVTREINFEFTQATTQITNISSSALKSQDSNHSLDKIDLKQKSNLTKYERGEAGIVHEVYASMFVKWFDYAIELGVPAVKKTPVQLKNRHSVGICVRELQYIMTGLAPDMILKAFEPYKTKYQKNNYGADYEIFIPYSLDKIASKCLLIGRNFDQWKICRSTDSYNSTAESESLKLHQKFSTLSINEASTYVTRQRLFLGIIKSNEIILYTYNWSKERIDKLIVQSSSLGLWMSARTSVLSSVVSQKRGIFQNQILSRKIITCNNPYLIHINESSDHLYKFPLGNSGVAKGEWSNQRKQNPGHATQGVTLDAFRDNLPWQDRAKYKKIDYVVVYTQEMQDLRSRYKMHVDEKKKMHGIWQSRGATGHNLQTNLLRKHSRIIHYCHTPLLFLSRWRFQSAATRDHSLSPEMLSESHPNSFSRSEGHDVGTSYDESWHHELCSSFIKEYKQYLQTLGFVPLELDIKKEKLNTINQDTNDVLCHVQKPMLGGIMVFSIHLKEPFFTVKLHAVECCRLQQKVSRNSINQFTLSFLDECDRIKSLMHLHSFTYDFHLRAIHTYVAGTSGPRVCSDYHLTKFLDDFTKYYQKTPNFARNVVCAETMSISDLLTEGNQLYIYLLSNNKHYNMQVLSMRREDLVENENEYVLVQVTSTPQVWYKDSQDRQQTDDFDVTLVVSNLSKKWQPNEYALHLKYYIILTSRREIYPKCDVEKTLGKFRTVSSGGRSGQADDSKIDIEDKPAIYEFKTEISKERTSEGVSSETSQNTEGYNCPQDEKISAKSEDATDEDSEEKKSTESETKTKVGSSRSRASRTRVEIKQESVNYIGYYSSHEQLMQQLILDRAAAARNQIRQMVDQGMVHCRTHLLWNKLVSHQELNQLTYNDFLELRGLAKLENMTDFHPDLKKMLQDQPFSWYQSLTKVLLAKYTDQHRLYVSPDGNIQHLAVLHPRYSGTFMMLSMDLHTSRGELYAASRELLQLNSSEMCNTDRLELIRGFINSVAAHIWSGMVTI